MRVPFLDLGIVHEPLGPAILDDFARLIDTGAFTNGPAVARFEQAFGAWVGADHVVGLASGLDALRFGLLAAGIAERAEVIVPANTFIATAEAVVQAGCRVVLADIGDDWNLDPAAASAAVTSRTEGIVPVHLYGQLADLGPLLELAARHDMLLVEDACQAHGARRDGHTAGASGSVGAFSFYPGKNLGAMGDAGAAVTADAGIAARMRLLREHGQSRKYVHDLVGYTSRLDTMQAAVLLRKLPLLAGWNEQRADAARRYCAALEGVGDLVLPYVPDGSEPVWHLFVVRTHDPTGLAEHLSAMGIGSGRHYPVPLHLTGAFSDLGQSEGAFPVAEALAATCLSLPIFPGITEAQLEATVAGVRAWFAGN